MDINNMFTITCKVNEIVQGYKGNPELLWSHILTNFSEYESQIKFRYNRNDVIDVAKPIYHKYIMSSNRRNKIRYLVKKMDEQTIDIKKIPLKLKHPNASLIFKEERNFVLGSLYELMDEYPITCLVLSGEFIKHGLIPNVYKEKNRGKIKNMTDEFKNWYNGGNDNNYSKRV